MTRTPLSYTGQLEAAARFIHEQDDFLVIAHVSPDGDAFGSTFAIGHVLQALGKKFVLANEDELPGKYTYLSKDLHILRSEELSRIPAHVICLDCADYSRLGAVTERIPESSKLLNIDHHPTNDYYGHVQVIRADAASTTEILFDLIELMQLKWTEELAEAVYTGMLTDTGGFRYANTTPALLEKSSKLLQYGVKANWLSYELLEKRSLAHIQLLKDALQTLSFGRDNRICWMIVSAEAIEKTNASPEDLDGLINYPRNIAGVEVGILFKQMDHDTVKVSLRSMDPVDVSAVASKLGGGGHKNAAGATINGPLEEIVHKVIHQVSQELGLKT